MLEMREQKISVIEILRKFRDGREYRLPSLADLEVPGQKMLMRPLTGEFLVDFPSQDFWGLDVVLAENPIRGGMVEFYVHDTDGQRSLRKFPVYEVVDRVKTPNFDSTEVMTLFVIKR